MFIVSFSCTITACRHKSNMRSVYLCEFRNSESTSFRVTLWHPRGEWRSLRSATFANHRAARELHTRVTMQLDEAANKSFIAIHASGPSFVMARAGECRNFLIIGTVYRTKSWEPIHFYATLAHRDRDWRGV